MSTQERVKIVVPGDDPVQIAGSPHLEKLKPYGDVELYRDRPQSSEEKIRRAKAADIIMNTRGVVTWGAEEFKRLPKLKMITSCSIGTDMFDLNAAKAQKIIICNQPGRTAPVTSTRNGGFHTMPRERPLTETRATFWTTPRSSSRCAPGAVSSSGTLNSLR